MAFNFLDEKMVSKQLLKKHETICSTRITIDEGEAIDKILDSFASAYITAEERVQDSVQFGGRVDFSILFENRTKCLSSVNGTIDFFDKSLVKEADFTYVYPNINIVRATKESENTIEVVVTLEVLIYGVKKDTIRPIQPNNEGFFESTKEITLSELTCASSDTFSLSEDVEVGEIITKIVAAYPLVSISKVSAEDNYILVEGEVVREFVYLSGEHVRRFYKSFDFVQEVSVLGAKKDMFLDVMGKLQSFDYHYEVFAEQNKTIIKSNANIKVNVFGFKEKTITVLDDVFSVDKKLLLSNECVLNNRFAKQVYFDEKFDAVFDASKVKRIDEIITVSNIRTKIEQSKISDDMLVVNGQIFAQVIYKNYERDSYLSTEIEVPFSVLNRDVEGVIGDVFVTAKYSLYKNKPGREIGLNFDLDFTAVYDSQSYDCFINGVDIVSEEVKNENAITIYYPSENQTTFDIAKELGISPEQLLSQNKGFLEDKTPEKVIVYRQS